MGLTAFLSFRVLAYIIRGNGIVLCMESSLLKISPDQTLHIGHISLSLKGQWGKGVSRSIFQHLVSSIIQKSYMDSIFVVNGSKV